MSLIASHAMEWRKGGIKLEAAQANSLLTASGVSVSEGGGQHAALTGTAGAASQLTGTTMATADEMYFILSPYSDLWMADLTRDLQFRIAYQGGNAADASIVWKAHIAAMASGDDIVDAVASADKVITFPNQTIVATDDFMVTETRGFGLAGTEYVDSDGNPDKDAIVICVELDSSGDASADELVFIYADLLFTVGGTYPGGPRQLT